MGRHHEDGCGGGRRLDQRASGVPPAMGGEMLHLPDGQGRRTSGRPVCWRRWSVSHRAYAANVDQVFALADRNLRDLRLGKRLPQDVPHDGRHEWPHAGQTRGFECQRVSGYPLIDSATTENCTCAAPIRVLTAGSWAGGGVVFAPDRPSRGHRLLLLRPEHQFPGHLLGRVDYRPPVDG